MIYGALQVEHQKGLSAFIVKTRERLKQQVTLGSGEVWLLKDDNKRIIVTQYNALVGWNVGIIGLSGLAVMFVFKAPLILYLIPLAFLALQLVFTRLFASLMLWLGVRKAGLRGKMRYVSKNKILELVLNK